MLAHYALHRFKIPPYSLFPEMELDPKRVRAFIYASINAQIKREKKEAARLGKR